MSYNSINVETAFMRGRVVRGQIPKEELMNDYWLNNGVDLRGGVRCSGRRS